MYDNDNVEDYICLAIYLLLCVSKLNKRVHLIIIILSRENCMAGKIKELIDCILEQRAGTNQTLRNTTKVKLQLKGINVDEYTKASPDDTAVIEKLTEVAKQLNVTF